MAYSDALKNSFFPRCTPVWNSLQWSLPRPLRNLRHLSSLTGREIFLELKLVTSCPRDKSRIVRRMIQEIIVPIYKKRNLSMPHSCPFIETRDQYYLHEIHKTEEAYARWACDFCGKTFYAEQYLDMHLHTRHGNKILKGPDAVCLSDYCDIFRCDIVSGVTVPDFWDTALCIQDDMVDMIHKCNKAFGGCIPQELLRNESGSFLSRLKSPVCSLLSCSRYWDTGQVDKSQWKMLAKTFVTVILFGLMIIYYFLAYHHFYAEPLFEDSSTSYDYRHNNQLLRRPLGNPPRKRKHTPR